MAKLHIYLWMLKDVYVYDHFWALFLLSFNCPVLHRLNSETRDFIEGVWTVSNCNWAGETRFCLNDAATLNSLAFSLAG